MAARRGSRIAVALAGVLLLPGLLVGAWAVVVFGGEVQELRAAEEREARAVLGDVEVAWRGALAALADDSVRGGASRIDLGEMDTVSRWLQR